MTRTAFLASALLLCAASSGFGQFPNNTQADADFVRMQYTAERDAANAAIVTLYGTDNWWYARHIDSAMSKYVMHANAGDYWYSLPATGGPVYTAHEQRWFQAHRNYTFARNVCLSARLRAERALLFP